MTRQQWVVTAACLLLGQVPTPAADIADLVRQSKPAILQLYPLDASGDPIGQATGFFWNSDGFALTNYHVIQEATAVAARSLTLPLPQTSHHLSGPAAFQAKLQKTDQISREIVAKLLARGRLDIARKVLEEEQRWSDAEERMVDDGRLDLCDELASKELQWIQGVYDKLH